MYHLYYVDDIDVQIDIVPDELDRGTMYIMLMTLKSKSICSLLKSQRYHVYNDDAIEVKIDLLFVLMIEVLCI